MPEKPPDAIISRHADKGKWIINEEDLRSDSRLSNEEATLIMTVLREELPGANETPLRKEGLIRSLRLGEELFREITASPEFQESGNKAVLLAVDSGKDRARLTRALATGRIAQLESAYNIDKEEQEQVRVDMIHLDSEEITKLLADSSPSTWGPYEKMIEKGTTEEEAIVQWLLDMNQLESGVDEKVHPKESAARYRKAVQELRKRVTAKNAPLFIYGAGHSGSLGQVRYEETKGEMTPGDSPQFCEMFKFNQDGEYTGSKEVALTE